ncbi:hypothetical protein JRO89_XS08G0132100 [Xanthoceras sorbifolium]|uniref:NAC domain-containing protein n=1 Tax=Xanthoceras sorbifolium TaxID=99658 RepID=A0ABQ8HPW5_9ROSI|nr:hypothetical protein JRO89_XS08G0132100 [Xanthoceras sorbifolium]
MEDFKVVNGGIRVPIGYRFLPTDEELVDYYLKRKVLGLPLPASIIPDPLDVFNTDPWSLPGKECNGKTKQIHVDSGVGMRTALVFRQGKRARTGWVMREYRLLVLGSSSTTTTTTNHPNPNPNSSPPQSEMGFGDWVVYCIFQRKKKTTKKQHGSSISAVSRGDDLSIINNSNKDLTCSTGILVMNRPSSVIDFAIEETTTDLFTPLQASSVSATHCLSELMTVETPSSSNGFDEDEVTSTAPHNTTSSPI